ncbi:MAG: ABC transporter substrate binding protein [Lachnospiraceae bacterium]|nr:ABC transporter substrate binding protein [Lachnospiraceae bacterium]
MKKHVKYSIQFMAKFSFCMILGIFFWAKLTMYTSAEEISLNNKRVLFISSYSESFITVPDQITGIRSGLEPYGVRLEIEYMDTKRFSGNENLDFFYQSLKYKFENGPKYDVIIVGDDAALQFTIDHKQDLFHETPVIFFGINDKERARLADTDPDMAGGVEETSLQENIDLAMTLRPEAKKVAAIVDNTLTGQGDQKQFELACKELKGVEPLLLNVSEGSFEEFGEKLEQLEPDTIVFLLSMNQDNTGAYLDLDKQFEFIRTHTRTPVFRASVGGVGEGLIGGKMIDYARMGEQAAFMAVQVLQGSEISSLPLITETPYHYYFDYLLIQKFEIDESALPQESVFVNRPVHPLEKYRNYIIMAALIVATLSILVVLLIFENRKLKKIQRELGASHEELTSIYEELTASEEELHEQYDLVEANAKKISDLYRKYDLAIKGTNSAVWELDLENEQIEITSSFMDIVGRDIRLSGNVYEILESLTDKKNGDLVIEDIRNYLYHGKAEIYVEAPTIDRDGREKWILIRGKAIEEVNDVVKKVSGIFLDITTSKNREAYIDYLAFHDYLTDLPNRMKFVMELKAQLESGRKGAVLLFDIDDFKSVNDTLGHVYGDELLKQIASRLKECQDEHLLAARLGGDEFLILLSDICGVEDVECYVSVLKNKFNDCFHIDGVENYVHYSMGITLFPDDSDEINQLIMNADTAMYEVKHNGKNHCIYYRADMKKQIQMKKEMETMIRQAITEDGFHLLYQPKVSAVSGEISGFEALLRMKGQNISPALFIPIAEESGHIIEIGRWVAKTVISQLSKWNRIGLQPKHIGINYSSKQLRDKEYIPYLCQLLEEYQVSADQLEIEITEGILLENNVETMYFLDELKRNGIRIALDDFGTGYSSLNYLTYIPVDVIKLDKSINDKFLNLEDSTVMDSLIRLAHSLKLEIVAEGIEEWDKFRRLQKGGCDYIQGYLFSKPIPVEEVEALYHKNFLQDKDS